MKLRSLMTAICVLASANVVSAAPFAFVANNGTTQGSISKIDTATNVVSPAVNLPPSGYPSCVAVGASGQNVYVGLQDTNSIAIFDTALNQVRTTISLGAGVQPGGLAVNAAETRLYVTNANSNELMVIDINNGPSLLTNVPVEVSPTSAPQGVVLSPDGTRAYVANMTTGTVAEVSIDEANNSYVRTGLITVGAQPIDLSISSDGTKVYVSSLSGAATVIDTANSNATTSLTVGASTATLAVDSLNSKVYAPSNALAKIYVIDPTQSPVAVLGTQYSTGTAPFASAVAGSKLFLTMNPTSANGSVEVYNTANLSAAPTVLSLPAGTKPSAIGNFIGPDFTNTITASDDNTNCVILPEGAIAVNDKGRTFNISALSGTCEVKVDGISVGQPSAYAFSTPVTADHTITATPIATGTYYTVSGDWITNVGACVTSDLNGINCASKSAKFLSGSTVVLKASTGFKVKAGTWGGDCAGSGDTCTLTNISADKFFGLTVQFEAGGTGPVFNTTKAAYYQTCDEAVAAAATNDVIKVSTAWTTGCTTAGTASVVTLSGNWSPDFSTQAGSTSMGPLTITNVGVIADNLTI